MAFYLIDKPRGITSFDVVHKWRKVVGTRRVGHTGTLDPLATGLLLVATDTSTKMIEYCVGHDKTYIADIRLDGVSETGDGEGPIHPMEISDTPPTQEMIQEVLTKYFSGTIQQVPPKYSALKIDGKRAYDLARKGEEVKIPSREVTIYSTEILSYDFPLLCLSVSVSSGTYIRSLASDLGEYLTGGGYLQDLRRTQIHTLNLEHPSVVQNLDISNDQVSEIPYDEIFPNTPMLTDLGNDVLQSLEQGRKISLPDLPSGKYFVSYVSGNRGLIQIDTDGSVRVLKNNV